MREKMMISSDIDSSSDDDDAGCTEGAHPTTNDTSGNDLYKRLVEHSFDGIVIHQKGVVVYINPAGCKLLGAESQDLIIGKPVKDFVSPDFKTEVNDRIDTIQKKGNVPLVEEQFIGIDGRTFDVEVVGVDTVYNGEPAVIAVFRDISRRKNTERKLTESEEFYRLTIESISDAVFLTDFDGNFLYICPNVNLIFGYSVPEVDKIGTIQHLIGKHCIDCDAIKNKEELHNVECEITDKSGGKRTILVNVKPVQLKGGSLLFTCREITVMKQSQKELLEINRQLQIILDAVSIGTWNMDVKSGKAQINENLIGMLGYQKDELKPDVATYKSLLHPDEKEDVIHRAITYIKNPEGLFEYRFRMKTKDNKWKWVLSRGQAIELDDRGHALRMIGIHLDITTIKETEEKISNLAMFPAENPYPVMRIGCDGELIYANPSSEPLLAMWNEQEEQAIPASIIQTAQKAVAAKEREYIEVTYGETHMMLTFVPIADKKYINVYGHDITELRKTEENRKKLEAHIQQIQKLESLGVLAGGIAHDFNNILVGILGNADLALMEMSPLSPARETVNEIKKAAHRAADLTSQMLAYSGKGRFIIELIDLNELLGEMQNILAVSVSKKATLKINLCENPPSIEADLSQMRQVIMNLVMNASDALGEKSGSITLSTSVIDVDRDYLSTVEINENLNVGRYVCIEVSDTGEGMTEAIRKKIFDPFFSTKFTGRGLGLPAVLGIVRGHRGAIKVYSESGKGTTIKVLFPAIESQKQKVREKIDHSVTDSPVTILVIDDEPSVVKVITKMIERLGYNIISAANGVEGIEMYRKHIDEIGLVLLDMTMPDLSGEDVFRELRKYRSDIPVILASGFNEQDATNRFAGKGLAGFIQKPFTMDNLLTTIRTSMKESRKGQ